MASLGDHFPNAAREAFGARAVAVGSVLRSKVEDTRPPKYKFYVVMGQNDDTGTTTLAVVYVNTHINTRIFDTPDKQAMHVPMVAASLEGIFDHDCFADCSQLFEKSADTLSKLVANDPQIVRGTLPAEQVALLRRTAASARTISVRIKKRYGLL